RLFEFPNGLPYLSLLRCSQTTSASGAFRLEVVVCCGYPLSENHLTPFFTEERLGEVDPQVVGDAAPKFSLVGGADDVWSAMCIPEDAVCETIDVLDDDAGLDLRVVDEHKDAVFQRFGERRG